MDVRQIIEFIKKPSSKLVLGFVVALMVIVFIAPLMSRLFLDNGKIMKQGQCEEQEYNSKTSVKAWKPINFDADSHEKSSGVTSPGTNGKNHRLSESAKRKIFDNKLEPNTGTIPQKTVCATPLNIYNSEAASKEKLKNYLPYGRLIPCELSVTLQTSNSGTPIIGIVTENVYQDGKLIIPSGSFVHGTTAGMPVRDHIRTGKNWTIVWNTRNKDNGKELLVKGVALENGSHWNRKNWDLLDGSAGIKGYTHDTRNISRLKDIAVNVVQGIGTGLQAASTLSALAPGASLAGGGTSSLATVAGEGLGGAISQGASNSAKVMAEESLANVLESEYYVTAPAGTQFYLYVEQTVDMRTAEIGASKS